MRYLKKFAFLTIDDIRQVWGLVKMRKVKEGEILVEKDTLNYNQITVIKGLLRNYIITSEGEERTVLIVPERMGTGCSDTIFRGEPAVEIVEAIEPSLVMIADTRKLERLADNHPQLLRLQKKILQGMLNEAIQRIRFYTALTPEERFREIQRKNPKLIQRVPQKYLASYLGIHPVSLSRIKARLGDNKKN